MFIADQADASNHHRRVIVHRDGAPLLRRHTRQTKTQLCIQDCIYEKKYENTESVYEILDSLSYEPRPVS